MHFNLICCILKNKKILYITPAFPPFLWSRMSERVFEVAKMARNQVANIRIFMPKYGLINERRFQVHEVMRLSGMNLIINGNDMPLTVKVASVPRERMQVYFIDNESYFKRKNTFLNEEDVLFSDNDERMIFFVKGVIESVKRLNWLPDIIHLYGWETALFPLYLKTFYKKDPLLKYSKIVFSLPKKGFEGNLNVGLADKIKFDKIKTNALQYLENPTFLNLMKNAILYSDAIVHNHSDISEAIVSFLEENPKPVCSVESGNLSASDCLDFYERELLPPEIE